MKDLLASKTMIGLIVTILGPVAARYGIDSGGLQLVVEAVVTAIGGMLTIYGRIAATKEITSVAGIPIK